MQPVRLKISGETVMVTISLGETSLQITGDAHTVKMHFPGIFKESLLNDMASLADGLAESAGDEKAGDEKAGQETGGRSLDRPPTLAELSDWFSTMALKLRKLQVRVDEWENDQRDRQDQLTTAIAGLANRAAALEAVSGETHERLNAVCGKLASLQERLEKGEKGFVAPEWGVEPQEHLRRIDALGTSATELRSITIKQGELIAALGKDVERLIAREPLDLQRH